MSCVFCKLEEGRLLMENDLAYGVLDKFPINEGHMLFIPKRHISSFFDATEAEVAALHRLIHQGKKYLDEKYCPDAYNLGINIGADAGQTIMHLHIHLIPRYKGDVEDPVGGVRCLKEQIVPFDPKNCQHNNQ